jgi:transcriptional regulator with XRE-family HTH domain
MIDYETYVRIRNYFTQEGLHYSQIADELNLDHRTVAKWANEDRYLPRRSVNRPSKLDPFKKGALLVC